MDAKSCYYCKRKFVISKGFSRLHRTKQHILPQKRGGNDDKINLRPCCWECNHLLDIVDDCPGALACARLIYNKLSNKTLTTDAANTIAKTWPKADKNPEASKKRIEEYNAWEKMANPNNDKTIEELFTAWNNYRKMQKEKRYLERKNAKK